MKIYDVQEPANEKTEQSQRHGRQQPTDEEIEQLSDHQLFVLMVRQNRDLLKTIELLIQTVSGVRAEVQSVTQKIAKQIGAQAVKQEWQEVARKEAERKR